MKKPKLLDSYAVLAYLNGKEGAGKVRQTLEAARDAQEPLLLTEINAGEVYYILSRKRGMDKADYFLETILPGLPIRLVPTDFPLVMEAARLKSSHPLSYADCFAVAAAVRAGAVVLTGDPEFGAVAEIIAIEWLCP